ncbi:DUF4141 domain-containing protein, partial [Bergeyella sp. RCAD1439]|nr:DUF4141 domain-containing protein [Bergeyella sp. RCAD1439]
MKRFIISTLAVLGIGTSVSVNAQWVVSDPGNLAQSIVNTAQEIVQTSSTAANTLNNFREVEK